MGSIAKGIKAITGRNNILLVAPHGNMKDDMGTAAFTLAVRGLLDCYAVINERFCKGENVELFRNVADLYKKEAFLHPEIKPLFWDRIITFLDEIFTTCSGALVLHIHGIKDQNLQKIAKLSDGALNHGHRDLRLIIGYGDHHKNPRRTADETHVVFPLVKSLTRNGLVARVAPIDPIVNDRHKIWYCGNDRNRMNQYLYNEKNYCNKLQSLQIELKYTGVRDEQGIQTSARKFAKAIDKLCDFDKVKGDQEKGW